MALPLIDAAERAQSPNFRGRVQAALVGRCIYIRQDEPNAPDKPANHDQRAAFASNALRAPGAWVENFAWVVATWPTAGDGTNGDPILHDDPLGYVVNVALDLYAEDLATP